MQRFFAVGHGRQGGSSESLTNYPQQPDGVGPLVVPKNLGILNHVVVDLRPHTRQRFPRLVGALLGHQGPRPRILGPDFNDMPGGGLPRRPNNLPVGFDGSGFWFRQASHPLHGDGVGLCLDLPRLHQRTVQVECDCVNLRSTLQTNSTDGCLLVRAEIKPYRPTSGSCQHLQVAHSLAVGQNSKGAGTIGNRQVLGVISRQLEE